jgi:type 1 glutamine amidotransferase
VVEVAKDETLTVLRVLVTEGTAKGVYLIGLESAGDRLVTDAMLVATNGESHLDCNAWRVPATAVGMTVTSKPFAATLDVEPARERWEMEHEEGARRGPATSPCRRRETVGWEAGQGFRYVSRTPHCGTAEPRRVVIDTRAALPRRRRRPDLRYDAIVPDRTGVFRMSARVMFAAVAALALACAAPAGAQGQTAPAPAQTAAQALAQAAPPTAEGRPIKVYLRAGLKTHAPGQHDYPQFLADFSKILTERGAIVDGSFHFPTDAEIADVDVIVMYKGDAGYMTVGERATLESFLRRGGGLVGIHDAICADDTAWWASIMGGAKKHGETNFTLEAPVTYTFPDGASGITKGATGFEITDEAFFLMTWAKDPGITVLATSPIAATRSAGTHAGEVVPQVWTYERTFFPRLGGQPTFRSFVWMQGHNYVNLQNPQVLPMLLRGIAWTAKAPLDSLLTVRTPPRAPGGGRSSATQQPRTP